MEIHQIGNIFWKTGPWKKKFFVSEERRNNHSCPWIEPASYILGPPDEEGEDNTFLPSAVYAIPNHEFCDLAYELPDFDCLPLFWNTWSTDGKPTRIIVQNIQDGDTIAINTEGYDYARYRASCKRLMPVV